MTYKMLSRNIAGQLGRKISISYGIMKETNITRREFLKLSSLGPLLAMRVKWPEFINERLPEVIYNFKTDLPNYAVTIDDGWNPDSLLRTLEALKEGNIQATFFIVGNAAKYGEQVYPGILQRLSDQGHFLAYHTVSHASIEELSEKSADWFATDYASWLGQIEGYLREDSKESIKPWARAPWGLFTNAFLKMCEEKGLLPFAWSADEGTLARNFVLNNGDILLFHVRKSSVEWIKKLGGLSPLSSLPMDKFLEDRISSRNRLHRDYDKDLR